MLGFWNNGNKTPGPIFLYPIIPSFQLYLLNFCIISRSVKEFPATVDEILILIASSLRHREAWGPE